MQSAHEHAVVEWLGEVPKHWEVCRNLGVFDERKECNQPQVEMLSVTVNRLIFFCLPSRTLLSPLRPPRQLLREIPETFRVVPNFFRAVPKTFRVLAFFFRVGTKTLRGPGNFLREVPKTFRPLPIFFRVAAEIPTIPSFSISCGYSLPSPQEAWASCPPIPKTLLPRTSPFAPFASWR